MIFPLYLTNVPKPVDEFIKKLDISSSKYTFTVITRIGTFSVADDHIDKVLKKSNRSLDATFMINMANNSPTGLTPMADKKWTQRISDEKIRALEDKVQENLDFIAECIVKREKIRGKGSMSMLSHIFEPVMAKLTSNKGTEIPFCTDSSCTKCGVCEKVCPSGKVKIVDGNVVWSKDIQCYFCYACFNFCPTQSVLVGNKYTLKNGTISSSRCWL